MIENGKILGRFKVENVKETISISRLSEVYVAEAIEDNNTLRTVAIKIVKNYSRTNSQESVELWKKLPYHKNIVELLEVVYDRNDIFLIMEYVQRRDLRSHINRFQTQEEIFKLLTGILEGIIHIHSQASPLIHRDIKPENILLREDFTPLLTDFGISRLYNAERKLQLTSEGFGGSFGYVPPEAFVGIIDQRTDLWAVGVIAFELMTGINPFARAILKYQTQGPEQIETIAKALKSVQLPGIPEPFRKFESFIRKALNMQPNLRFATAAEMKEALFNAMNNESSYKDYEATGHNEIDLKLEECINTMRILTNRAGQKFRIEILKEILDGLQEELEALTANNYKFDIGTEKNFLLRAGPLFNNADKIYAISLDTVSSFWTTKKKRELALDYIEKQPENTIRLFVFKSPKRAHQYSKILNANYRKYGKGGANMRAEGMVLICSFKSYQNFLSNYTGLNLEAYEEKDFGLLKYGDQFIEATLDVSELQFQPQNMGRRLHFKRLVEKFDELLSLEDGEIDESTNFLKWSPRFLTNREIWAETLEKIFEERAGREYYHLVFFSGNVNEKVVIETKRQLIEKKLDLGLDDVWVGTRQRVSATDGEYNGILETGNDAEWNRILIMRFKSKEELQRFYGHSVHSKIRKYAFSNFNTKLDNLYNELTVERDGVRRFELYCNVEALARDFMERRDYVDAEQISDLVKHEPINF